MPESSFRFTDRARPVVQVGIGDFRVAAPGAVWGVSRWDQTGSVWAGVEPTWVDVSCDIRSYRCEYGRQRTTDRFIPGIARVVLNNASGWADPALELLPTELAVRPGRAIRMGVEHVVHGTRWLFRGFIDAMTPTYHPTDQDTVELSCIDALAEVNRAKLLPFPAPVGTGDSVDRRVNFILDLAQWPTEKRDIQPTGEILIAHNMGGQVADLLGRSADSGAGSIFGDTDGNVVYRGRDWQAFPPGTPVDGTIGNVNDSAPNRVTFGEFNYLWFGDQIVEGESSGASDVCPTQWTRPFARADIATRVIVGRDAATAQQVDDPDGQRRYGIEPFERVDLLTESDARLLRIAQRILNTRAAATAPRVRSVTLDAATADNALDLMTTVDVFKPSRYRCRLVYPTRTVFDEEYFATGVAHEVTPTSWTLELNLDSAAPYQVAGGRWGTARWDQAVWAPDVGRTTTEETAA